MTAIKFNTLIHIWILYRLEKHRNLLNALVKPLLKKLHNINAFSY